MTLKLLIINNTIIYNDQFKKWRNIITRGKISISLIRELNSRKVYIHLSDHEPDASWSNSTDRPPQTRVRVHNLYMYSRGANTDSKGGP